MKKLTIEEKAKRYDEAIEKAKSKIEDDNFHVLYEDDVIEIFPELAESEEEKTKRLLHTIANKISQHLRDIFTEEEFQCYDAWSNAWLEKQGEPKDHDVCDNCDQQGSCVSPCCVKLVEKNGEQKPIDKVEPKFKVGDEIIKSSKSSCPVHSSTDDTICKVTEIHDNCYILDTKEGKIQEPFKWQDYYELIEQKPAAWSEEDEEIHRRCICAMRASACGFPEEEKFVGQVDNWLKSLKDRVQSYSQWKPSNEQMRVLEWCKPLFAEPESKGILESLIDDLKKLK